VFKIAPGIFLAMLFVATGLAAGQAHEQVNPPPSASGDATTQPALPQRVRISEAVSTGLLIKKAPPKYPEKARHQRIQGPAVLQAIINREGKIVELTPVSGDPLLTSSAMKTVKKWRYKPYLLNGQPVEVETTVQVNFTLSGG
jgi:periplasmic protein TonB